MPPYRRQPKLLRQSNVRIAKTTIRRSAKILDDAAIGTRPPAGSAGSVVSCKAILTLGVRIGLTATTLVTSCR